MELLVHGVVNVLIEKTLQSCCPSIYSYLINVPDALWSLKNTVCCLLNALMLDKLLTVIRYWLGLA